MKNTVRLLGSMTLLGVLAWRMDWGRVATAFAGLSWGLWLAAVVLFGATQVVSTLRWRMLARVHGFEAPLSRYLAYYFIAMFFNLFLPTSVGGDVVRAWYLARRERSASAPGRGVEAFLSVFADRFNGVLVLVALACVAALWCPPGLPAWIPWTTWGAGAASLIGLASFPLLARLAGPTGQLRRLVDGGRTYLRNGRVLLGATALSVVVQLANVVLVWWIGLAMGLPVPPLYYGVFVPLVTLLTLVPVSVNGMGLREFGMVLLLEPLGIGTAEAVTLAFLWFAVFGVTSLGGIGVYLFGHLPRFVADVSPAGLEVRSDDDDVRGGPDQRRTRQPTAAA